VFVGVDSDHGDIVDFRVGHQEGFEVGGSDLESLVLDQLFDPVDDTGSAIRPKSAVQHGSSRKPTPYSLDETVLVDVHAIARLEPSLRPRQESLLGSFLVPPISFHDPRSPHAEFSRLTRWQVFPFIIDDLVLKRRVGRTDRPELFL
jgi:hypothetical protein